MAHTGCPIFPKLVSLSYLKRSTLILVGQFLIQVIIAMLTISDEDSILNYQVPVVQTLDSAIAIHRMNHYPADKALSTRRDLGLIYSVA